MVRCSEVDLSMWHRKADGFCCCKYVNCIVFSRKDISCTVGSCIRTQIVSIFMEHIARNCARYLYCAFVLGKYMYM